MGDVIISGKLEEYRAARPKIEGGEPRVDRVSNVVAFPERRRSVRPAAGLKASAAWHVPWTSLGTISPYAQRIIDDFIVKLKQRDEQCARLIAERNFAEEKVRKLEAKVEQLSLPPLPPKSLWSRLLDCFLGRSP